MSGEQAQEVVTQEIAADATKALAELQARPDFAAKYVSKTDGWEEKRAFARLMQLSQHDKAKGGDRLDQIIAGTVKIEPFETTTGSEISTYNAMQTAAGLREIGLSDPQIKQAMDGKPVSKAEFDMVRTMRADRTGNAEWAAKYLKGDTQAVREMALMNTVIAAGYVGGPDQPASSVTFNIRRMA
jgi:hypothetical protein